MSRLEIFACDGTRLWPYFAKHHYLTGEYHGHFAVIGLVDDQLAAFSSCIAFPTGTIKQPCKRGHRTVVLPDFQGRGIGSAISEVLADTMLRQGFRYFVKTAHPRLGEHRNRSPLWRQSTWNLEERSDRGGFAEDKSWVPRNGQMYCHEFVGSDAAIYDAIMNPKRAEDKQLRLFDAG